MRVGVSKPEGEGDCPVACAIPARASRMRASLAGVDDAYALPTAVSCYTYNECRKYENDLGVFGAGFGAWEVNNALHT